MSQNGIDGYKVSGPNGNSIFLPAAGCRLGSSLYDAGSHGSVWSSTPYDYYDGYAYGLSFSCGYHGMDYYGRRDGRSVRPVLE